MKMSTEIYSIPATIPKQIFRAYDVRGIVDEDLTENVIYALGLALGSEAKTRGVTKLVCARDGRLSGPTLYEALKTGLLATGINLMDVGMVPTPVLYFATHYFQTHSGVMLTGSHNPVNFNGVKMTLAGHTLVGSDIQNLYQRIVTKDFTQGAGILEKKEIINCYIERIVSDIKLTRSLKIAIDCGNGVAGVVAPNLFRALGCEVTELFTDIDGNFPNHHPDPAIIDNLTELINCVKTINADVGLAFDGDGDRLGVITNEGELIWPDRQMILFAKDVLSRNPGSVCVFDVKCSKHLPRMIEKYGGKPVMCKTGHSFLKAKMQELNAPLAGEMSGHIFFKERWYGFDDGLYVAARLLEILAKETKKISEIFAELPNSINTPELKLSMSDDKKFHFMEKLKSQARFVNAKINTIDGLRADFKDGWGLIRPSNTTPCLVLRFEADNEAALKRIQQLFKDNLLAIDPSLTLPY